MNNRNDVKVMVVGAGGREHALAWKLSQSGRARLACLPGNPGMEQIARSLPGRADDPGDILAAARENEIELVIIGPEAPLAAGAADVLREAGFLVFGPSARAAEIESSKAFAKDFMERRGIPTARYQAFSQFENALDYLRQHTSARQVVIKASGLAAGKGVYLPETMVEGELILKSLLVEDKLGPAGRQVVIEERLQGREVSILAFTDGRSLSVMPPVQDHKRLLDDDLGPNTGGMGTFAPSLHAPAALVEQVTRQILQPVVDGLREEGRPFTGVLYAGLILTAHGPRVLEFNSRFGDPETQVLMPLLETDLLEICLACAQGRLAELAAHIRWREGAAACVVLASPGYPEKSLVGREIFGLEALCDLADTWVFHAGTSLKDGKVVTSGGRVLGITAYGHSLETAVQKAYHGASRVSFEGMHFRRDIGRDFVRTGDAGKTAYESAGVSIAAGNRAVAAMRQAVRATFTPQVLSDVGAFGGLYHAGQIQAMHDPVLVASTDGIGTKVDLAARQGRFRGLGHDIVNHCINDILVQGARPLFFLDYIASGRLDPEMAASLVSGMSEACCQAGCALLGGETAEMPGVYAEGRFDVAGTIVGVVEREAILPRGDIAVGDQVVGLRSSGPHTNGYSLLRRIFAGALDSVFPELGVPVIEALLVPHRSYLPLLVPLLEAGRDSPVKALAHLTGGGFIDNIPRVLPRGRGVRISRGSWPVPPLFSLAQRLGKVAEAEMYHVFNMGIGMIAIVSPGEVSLFQKSIPEETWVIGEVTAGDGVLIQ